MDPQRPEPQRATLRTSRRRPPGRPPAVDLESIAEAVLAVGFTDLTMAAVAEHLQIGQATLYRHVPTRDELVRLGLDLALRRTEWPPVEGPWQEVLLDWATCAWYHFADYPGSVAEVSRGVVPPTLIQLAEEVAVVLLRAGFAPQDAVLVVDLVFDTVADHRRGVELLDKARPDGSASLRDEMYRQWTSAVGSLPSRCTDDERRQVRHALAGAIQAEPIEWLRKKLLLVITGADHQFAHEGDPR